MATHDLRVVAVAFWMVFGGTVNLQALPANDTCAAANLVNPTYTQTIKGMHVPDEMIFTMYRLTLVDEYDLDVCVTFYTSLTAPVNGVVLCTVRLLLPE